MWSSDTYELLDFGEGRKLERFGGLLLDRPCRAAEGMARAVPRQWSRADLKYERQSETEGRWHPDDVFPKSWKAVHGEISFALRPTPFGHVGIFPEQADNWDWIATLVRQARQPINVLNLFAYTGGSTLAAAAAGAAVVHVDAARAAVQWARQNAELSGLGDRPVRWIVDDAIAFVKRELRRGNRYDAIILDPPSYGHGPDGQAWKMDQHLSPLLSACAELSRDRLSFVLLTCHTPGFGPPQLKRHLEEAFGSSTLASVESKQLALTTREGRPLPSGVVARLTMLG